MRGCGPAAVSALVILLAVVVILPKLGGAPDQAVRIACAANLRSIGQAIQIYEMTHGGQFPDTFKQLYLSRDLPDYRVLTCPASTDTLARGATTQALAADLAAGGHMSYVYLGAGLTSDLPPDTVLAHDAPGNHGRAGGNVIFADTHVKWMDPAALARLVALSAAGVAPIRRADVLSSAPIVARPTTATTQRATTR